MYFYNGTPKTNYYELTKNYSRNRSFVYFYCNIGPAKNLELE